MSRKKRTTHKNFKVFCEGDTEYHYIDEMRRQQKLSITLKTVNMKGGGYSNFLEKIKTDGTANCLAKFIIIDGDRAVTEDGEKKNLQELSDYCTLQNKSGRIPHFLIVNHPDFEYVACLHLPKYKGQNAAQYLLKELGYKSIDMFKADSKIYHVLNTGQNSYTLMLSALSQKNCFITNNCSINRKLYEIRISSTHRDWQKLEKKGSNINEFFEVVNRFLT